MLGPKKSRSLNRVEGIITTVRDLQNQHLHPVATLSALFMFIFPREGDQRSRSRSQPSCSWEGACEGEGPNFVSSNGAQVSFLILCNTSSSTDVSRITIHFMKNLRLLAAESLSPLVVGLFSFPRWHEERVHSTSSYCENKIFGALSL